MITYSFKATRLPRRNGFVMIKGRLKCDRDETLPGSPFLRPVESPDPTERVYELVFEQDPRFDLDSFHYTDPKITGEVKTIRILLPEGQEHIIRSQRPRDEAKN